MLSLNMLLPPPSPFLLLPPSLLLTPPPGAQRLLMSTSHRSSRVSHLVPSSSDSGSLGIIITNSQTSSSQTSSSQTSNPDTSAFTIPTNSNPRVLTVVGRRGLTNVNTSGFVNLRGENNLQRKNKKRRTCARSGRVPGLVASRPILPCAPYVAASSSAALF